jgi:GR25 family glycosyltransferase involved in LPS biosynthesis
MDKNNIKYLLKDIPIFWINLDRAKRRRNIFINIFDTYNLEHTRIEAIDGNNIDLEEYKSKYNVNEKMSKFEVACALSHLKAIKLCYDQNLEFVLILEDDANFDYFKYKKKPIIELLDDLKNVNGDSIQLANIMNRKIFPYFIKINKLLVKGDYAGAQSYLITKEGMKKVLNNFEKTKSIQLSEHMIFKKVNNYVIKPYFSYPFLRDENGNKVNLSFIRSNTKGAHATQTLSKMNWDKYYAELYD